MPLETRNYTPFPALAFESRGHRGEVFHIHVIKGTFRLANGPKLKPVSEQQPLIMSDEYYGDPTHSSVRIESDINPFKPATDIHVIGAASSLGGKPLQAWEAGVRVGNISKRLRVTGRRSWVHHVLRGWTLSDPEPCTQVPLRYELAYGGSSGEGDSAQVCKENPVGRGFVGRKSPRKDSAIEAPQIEALTDPIGRLGRSTRPEGFSPVARSWQPRLSKAGSFDALWLNSRWPDIPDDFDFSHYNSAHPDLVVPGYLNGDEPVELYGFHTEGSLKTALPAYTVFSLVRLLNGVMAPAVMNLDTVVFDLNADLAYLTWRCRVPAKFDVRVLEARMILPEGNGRG